MEDNEEKIYLNFFQSLFQDKEDKEIIELVMEDLEEEEIVQKLLSFKEH